MILLKHILTFDVITGLQKENGKENNKEKKRQEKKKNKKLR